jgi:hypothetical protein
MSARQRILALCAATLVACAASACSQNHTPQRQLTERERDSTLGKSVLPGAVVVTRALAVSDSATVQAQRMDGATSGQ